MKKYRVTLTAAEREELERLLARGKADVRKLKHAQVLLKPDLNSCHSQTIVIAQFDRLGCGL